MYTYIRKAIKGYYVETPDEIAQEYWDGWIGSTYEDFLNGKWVLLSDEQVTFREEHPNASIKEVWNKELDPQSQPHIPTEEELLEEAKLNKIADIDEYDQSENVNSFSISGNNMWLTREDRTQIDESINAYEGMG